MMKIWKSKSGDLYYSVNDCGDKSFTSREGRWVEDKMDRSYPPRHAESVLIYDSNAQPDKVEEDPEEARIDKALAVIRERHDLCEEFDVAVDRAKNLSLLERLEFVAYEEWRMDLHTELVKELDKPVYEPPAVPENGDYVKVTYLNGDTVEGEVRGVGGYTGFTGLHVGAFSRWTIIPDPGTPYVEREPQNVAATIEVVKQPVKPVEIDGYWVKRREVFGDVAAWSNAECEGLPTTTANSLERAYEKIKDSSDVSYMRKYIPALLAIVKFFEQEDQ